MERPATDGSVNVTKTPLPPQSKRTIPHMPRTVEHMVDRMRHTITSTMAAAKKGADAIPCRTPGAEGGSAVAAAALALAGRVFGVNHALPVDPGRAVCDPWGPTWAQARPGMTPLVPNRRRPPLAAGAVARRRRDLLADLVENGCL